MFCYLNIISNSTLIFMSGAESTTFTFSNNCPYTVWPATLQNANLSPLSQTGFVLPRQAPPVSLNAPIGWGGRFWARTHCSKDSAGKFTCLTGDCGSGEVVCNGAGGAPPTTLVEFTLQGDGGKDFYDVSLVDGFNVPVSVTAQVGSRGACSSTACPADINSGCPPELSVKASDGSVVGCKSACDAFNTDQFCCRGAYGSAETCPPTNYSEIFKKQCPQAYSYAFDDKSSTFTCIGATGYQITFCP